MIRDLKNQESKSKIKNQKSRILRFRYGEWSHFRLGLGVRERSQLRRNPARDRGQLAPRLETREVGPVAPGERTAEPHARFDRRVVDDVDRALVVGRALLKPRKVAEVPACGKERRDAG